MAAKQKTISRPASVSGRGLHSGKIVNLTFRPSQINSGICFKRIDLDDQPLIKADCHHVVDTNRGTSIGLNGAKVCTIEHLMAAVCGLEIDNLLVEIDNVEVPILDGSAKFFYQAMKSAGIREQDADKEFLSVDTVLSYADPLRKTEIMIVPADHFKLTVMIDFETEILSSQNAVLEEIGHFGKEIANCRTFVFLHELEYLLKNDLVKGGDLSNAIVFVEREITQTELDRLTTLFNKPSVKVLNKGILNNIELYFENEPARHKLLDMIGDLSLVGMPIKGHVIATRPGHSANIEFARMIKKHAEEKEENRFKPPFDLNKPPLFDINDIKRILPHRPPFLLIDKIMDLSDNRVTGVKNVTVNEGYFVGHFPEEPVMPGVLQIEAMAQTGGIFALGRSKDPQNYRTLLLKIENIKFRSIVVPGDTVVFSLELISPIRRGLCHMRGTAYVGEKVVMEGEMLAQLIKKEDLNTQA